MAVLGCFDAGEVAEGFAGAIDIHDAPEFDTHENEKCISEYMTPFHLKILLRERDLIPKAQKYEPEMSLPVWTVAENHRVSPQKSRMSNRQHGSPAGKKAYRGQLNVKSAHFNYPGPPSHFPQKWRIVLLVFGS